MRTKTGHYTDKGETVDSTNLRRKDSGGVSVYDDTKEMSDVLRLGQFEEKNI